MAEIWLLCEGDSDRRVLDSVFARVLSAEIVVRPSGGSRTAGSAAAFVRKQYEGTVAAYVVDRDYSRRDEADASFTDGQPRFMWRRHAIENYLIAPTVIVAAFQQLKASVPHGRLKALPDTLATVEDGLRACAMARAPQEAGRLAMERLWEDLSDTAGRVQRRLPDVLRKSECPDAGACRQALRDEATRLVTKAGEAAASPHLSSPSVAMRYDDELARVNAASYMAALLFLEEFNGWDLIREFTGWLQREHKVPLRREIFVEELEKALPTVYAANRSLYGTDDFGDLANGVRALAGLPALT